MVPSHGLIWPRDSQNYLSPDLLDQSCPLQKTVVKNRLPQEIIFSFVVALLAFLETGGSVALAGSELTVSTRLA